jgi:hypothetical protein
LATVVCAPREQGVDRLAIELIDNVPLEIVTAPVKVFNPVKVMVVGLLKFIVPVPLITPENSIGPDPPMVLFPARNTLQAIVKRLDELLLMVAEDTRLAPERVNAALPVDTENPAKLVPEGKVFTGEVRSDPVKTSVSAAMGRTSQLAASVMSLEVVLSPVHVRVAIV